MARRPKRLWEQYEQKALAELARGSGEWPLQPHPCGLEPPHEPYNRRTLTVWDCYWTGYEKPWEASLLKRVFDFTPPVFSRHREPLILPAASVANDLVAVAFAHFPADEVTVPKAEQLLRSLPATQYPVAFELIGRGPAGAEPPSTTVQFVADRQDADLLEHQLLVQYPNSAITTRPLGDAAGDQESWNGSLGYGAHLALKTGYCFPLRTFTRIDPDPFGVAIAALDQLREGDWALLQILFQTAFHPWAQTANEATADPYNPGTRLFPDLSDRLLNDKFSSPLFAVAVRVLTSRDTVYRQLLGWVEQFAAPEQRLISHVEEWPGETTPEAEWMLLCDAVQRRCTYRPGMLLNVQELAGLAHLPSQSVIAERLVRISTRTKAAPAYLAKPGSVILGQNTHRGHTHRAGIPTDLRAQHCYIAGASGTGKSTLVLNMLLQDIAAGAGVGLIDPHGDLVQEVLARIPADRVDDVVYFNPSDKDFPVGFNLLQASGETERERLVAETVATLRRFYPEAWGVRLEHILRYAVATVARQPGATLRDVRRLLTGEVYRTDAVSRLRDGELTGFWEGEFLGLRGAATEPVLNKLSPFLLDHSVRNIVCQRRSTIDIDAIVNGRKILLANLSIGRLAADAAGIFGTFLITKIFSAALRRVELAREERGLWFLYVDEFQNFMDVGTAKGFEDILSQARKYGVVLTLANQYVAQLTSGVRSAIFGNIGTLVMFRVGVDDARLFADEFHGFTSKELLSLKRGQALARVDTSASAFNLATFPEPARPPDDHTAAIIARCRERYARPREDVEAELEDRPLPPRQKRKRKKEDGRDVSADPVLDDLVT